MTDSPSANPDDSGRHQSLGALLRTARERKGMELEDVAEVTHVRKEYLNALEEGRYSDLPEDVYARNFLRLFGQAVGLESASLLERFTRERSAPKPTRTPTMGSGRAPAVERTPPAPSRPTEPPARSSPAPQRAEQRADPRPRTTADAEPGPSFAGLGGDRRGMRLPGIRIGSWIATILLIGGIVAVALWAFNNQLFRSGRTPPPAASDPAPGGTGDPGIAIPPDGSSPSAPSGTPAATEQARDVLITVESEPPGAQVTVDGFALPGTTPVRDVPVTARASRELQLTLDGYQPFEATYDLSFDRTISVILEPAVAEAPVEPAGPDGDAPTPPVTAGSGEIALNVTEATWLEVYSGTARGQGSRLVYTTAQPGDRFVFDLPVYVHVGNASGLHVSVDGQDLGAFGSSGAVVGRAYQP